MTTMQPIEPMALRINGVAKRLDISRRSLERLISSGKFPGPNRKAGRMGLWSVKTVQAWIDGAKRTKDK